MRSNLRITSPNHRSQLLSHGDDTRWTTPTTPTLGKNHDQEEDHEHHIKKSVLAKVKEKARKWRNTLAKKKHGQDDNATPAWGVSLDDDNYEEDPEYFGAPMYESELAPEACKEAAYQHPRDQVPVIAEKHVLVTSISPAEEQDKKSTSKTITESVSEKLAPAYAMVSEATQTIASKIQGVVTTREETTGNEHKWDKGVSVKEYLMQKLEPGEEERALSQVITDVMSPKKAPNDTGVVDKGREALSSMLGMESSSLSTTETTNMSRIPVSTSTQEVVEEENHGRILQAN